MIRIAVPMIAATMAAHLSFAAVAETRIVIDAPDVQRLAGQYHGASLSELIGTDVYSNSGKRIGEVEDFRIARGGYVYAVIDIQQGPLDGIIELADDDLVVVPLEQLRTVSVQE